MMANTIICPSCGKPIEISQALRAQVNQEIRKQTEEQIRKELGEKARLETEDLKKSLAEKEKKVEELIGQELKLREEKRRLEEKEKELNLEVERRLDEIKKKTEEEVLKKSYEQHRLADLEKDKIISDLKTALEEAQRKAQQQSQQLKGEVMELDLENTLRSTFPGDTVEPVEKGVRGADIRQVVKSPRGHVCGVILWESKRTKAWSEEWLMKLKADLRAEGANIPVIVTNVLPKEARDGLALVEGVWVVGFNLVLPLAILLRKNLLEVAYQKLTAQHKGDKADLLYEYVTGHEFRQQVEAMIEVYKEMQEQISRERAAFEKGWKVREGQIKRLLLSTANVCGEIQGTIGPSMPQIKGLDLLEEKT